MNNLAELDLAADAEGRLTALWSRTPDLVVVSATRSASGAWSDPVVLETALEDGDRAPIEPHIAADAQGELIATWSPGDDALMVATRGANATSWSVERRAVRGSHDTIRPDVAFDRFGNATLVWGETTVDDSDAPVGGRVRAQTRRPDGTWADAETVYATPTPASPNAFERPGGPRVVVGDACAATVVWADGRSQSPRFGRLTAASRPIVGGAWDAAVPLTTVPTGALRVPDNVRADALGDVVVPFVPLTSTITPATVEPQLLDLDLPAPARLDWSARWLPGSLNLRTFVRYLRTDPSGGVTLSGGGSLPAPLDPWGYRLTQSDAWKDQATGDTLIQLRGTMRQSMPSHFIDIRIVDPIVRIAADGKSARVFASGQGSGVMNPGATEPTVDPFTDVHLLDLDLTRSGPRRTAAGSTTSWLRAPATIASIEAQRYLSYGQGTPYGTWTLTAPSDLPVRSTPAPGAPVTVEPPTTEPPTIDPPTTAPPTTVPPTTAPPEVTGPPTVAPTAPTPPAPGGAAPPQKPKVVRISGRVLGKKAARRTLTVRLTTRVGTRAKRSYSVVLRRGTRIVATGTLRGTTLRLSVRSTAKKGRKAKYARIRGTYTLATPNRIGKKRPTAAQRITSTRITVR